jgi:hypothetical protein
MGYLSGTQNPNPIYAGGTTYMGPYSAVSSPPLIGQGLQTYIYELIYPTPPTGSTNQYIGLGVQLFAGASISQAIVPLWAWAQTGSGGAPIWGINAGVNWAPGTPDADIQAVEFDVNNNVSNTFTLYKDGVNIFSGGAYHAGIALYILANNPGTNNWQIGAQINNYINAGLFISPTDENVPGTGSLVIEQIANSSTVGDTILMQRYTDSTPLGYFIRAESKALSSTLFSVDVSGNLTSMGSGIFTGQLTTASGLTVSGSGSWSAPSNCGSLSGSTKCFEVVDPNGNIMSIPAYGTY